MDENVGTPEAPGAEAGAGSRFNRAKEFVGDKYASAADTVKNQYSTAKEKVGETYSQVREKVEDIDFKGLSEQARGYVRSNPGKALLISVGVGFVIGLLLRKGDDE